VNTEAEVAPRRGGPWLTLFLATGAVTLAVVSPIAVLTLAAVDLFFAIILMLSGKRIAARESNRADGNVARSARTLTVLLPCHNEESSLPETMAAITRNFTKRNDPNQRNDQNESPRWWVFVIDDGSTDRTFEIARQWQEQAPYVRVLRTTRLGKAGAMNLALREVETELCVTIDADCRLDEGALENLADSFAEPDVAAVSGSVFVDARTPDTLLAQLQSVEYARSNALRAGLSRFGLHEQAPGALTAFRTQTLRMAGGFQESLTEDYATIFALKRLALAQNATIHVRHNPNAFGYTRVPTSLSKLMQQRTRWFQGFLDVISDYRDLLFAVAAGRFGMVRMPMKLLDTIGPILLLVGTVRFCIERTNAWSSFGYGLVAYLGAGVLLTSIAQWKLGASMRRSVRNKAWILHLLEPGYALLRALLVLPAYLRHSVQRHEGTTPPSSWTPRR
jgi:cellulose synthase/poly-beta-1,6-N-acetylglucosamine synthase-like glycosyltransferase